MTIVDLEAKKTISLIPSVAPHTASDSQRAAIEAEPQPLLVLAGPGAGKTFCLIERIRFLIEKRGFEPARICAFAFTNKAAEEIASRLAQLGSHAERIKCGTIHAFCAELLRESGDSVGLSPGFGIADQEYQLTVLARLQGPKPWHPKLLTDFSAHRFCDLTLSPGDRAIFDEYEHFVRARNLLDFDMLVLNAAELLENPSFSPAIRARWSAILVDEFQDLNSAQYRVVHELAREHRNIFAVGDHEQSIFSWTGADRSIFDKFLNDFDITSADAVHLKENYRCPREVFDLARILVAQNPTLFDDYEPAATSRDSGFPVEVRGFENDQAESAWIANDIRRDLENGHTFGDVGILYRKHTIGETIESAFLSGGIPCRLARGRALADEPIVAYVVGALRVISHPEDDIWRDSFFALVLPRALFDEARARAESANHDLRIELNHMFCRLPDGDERRRQIGRALAAWRNLEATSRQHETISSLVQELVAQRPQRLRSILDERHDDLSDPAGNSEVVRLADLLRRVREADTVLWIPRLGGAEIALKSMLAACGFRRIRLGGAPPTACECFRPEDIAFLGPALGLFKAIQLLDLGGVEVGTRDFTTIDLETTDADPKKAEILEIAAVRVRNGEIVDQIEYLVKPQQPIPEAATEFNGISNADVASASSFEDLWPEVRAFCGDDMIVAHNGYEYDFLILKRMVRSSGGQFDLCLYDTLPLARDLYPTSRKLDALARQFQIDTGRSHRALDDARTLAQVFIRLDDAKMCRARKTARLELLDRLGLALALSDEKSLCDEARLFLDFARPRTLGRYSSCLEAYERERADDESIFTVDEAIDRLGGVKRMEAIRREKKPDERYPGAMLRLRGLTEQIPRGPRQAQIDEFLERAVLSKWDGTESDSGRVTLLTLHATKGLEFSRVYIVGAEDAELPGGHPSRGPTVDEVEESRRLLYVGMTRAKERLVITRVETRRGKLTGGHQFLTEMGLLPF